MEPAETGRRPHPRILMLRRKLSAAGRFSLYALNRFNRDGCFAASGALSYTTLVSLVPLGVIAFGILSIFPNFASLRGELLGFVFRNFVPAVGAQAGWWFEYFAGSAAQATAFGIIGIAGTGVLLLVTVDHADQQLLVGGEWLAGSVEYIDHQTCRRIRHIVLLPADTGPRRISGMPRR